MTLGEFITSLGYLVGLVVLFWAARERKLLTEGMGFIALWSFLGSVLGAKLGEWIFNGMLFRVPLAILNPSNGGKALLGGVLGGWLAAEIAKWRLGIHRSVGDLFALSLPAGEAVGSIGCFFNQCCYGKPTDGPWRVYQHGAWRHPTQLYSSAVAVVLLVLLLVVRKRGMREGDLFKLYLILFGLSRFGMEFLREQSGYIFGLSAMQWLCLELALTGGVLFAFHRKQNEPPATTVGQYLVK